MELVFIENGEVVTDSLTLSKTFEKRHSNVIQAIEKLECSKEFNELNFKLVNYVDKKGELRPKYNLTYDGFVFVAMGFTGKKAAKFKEEYIREFNRVKEALLFKTEQLREIVESSRQKELSIDDINKIRFSEKRTLGTFEHSNMDEMKKLVGDFIGYVKSLDAKTRQTRCKSAEKGIKRLHDRLASEGVTNIGDCYNLLMKIDEIKSVGHMAENKRNGGIKASQTKEIKKLKAVI